VPSDPSAIGFVAAAHVRTTKTIAVSSASGVPMQPTPFLIATEAYPLTRRLYLYTPERSPNPLAVELVTFALSDEGQQVVRSAGFVDLTISAADLDPCTKGCPARYAAVVKGARRASLDFRFRAGTLDLDSRAPDASRLARFVQERDARIALVGFSDTGADAAAMLKDSQDCAHSVEAILREHGLSAAVVEGFGNALPIALASDTNHAYRNRHVEVWFVGDHKNLSAAEPRARTSAPAPDQPRPQDLLKR
jgi:phosphate transport system substrate-binding protein